MSGHCKDCKWAEEEFRIVNGASLGLECKLLSDDDETFYRVRDDDKKLATIASYEPARFRVKPEFGCVQFEPKEAK